MSSSAVSTGPAAVALWDIVGPAFARGLRYDAGTHPLRLRSPSIISTRAQPLASCLSLSSTPRRTDSLPGSSVEYVCLTTWVLTGGGRAVGTAAGIAASASVRLIAGDDTTAAELVTGNAKVVVLLGDTDGNVIESVCVTITGLESAAKVGDGEPKGTIAFAWARASDTIRKASASARASSRSILARSRDAFACASAFSWMARASFCMRCSPISAATSSPLAAYWRASTCSTATARSRRSCSSAPSPVASCQP
mmetsp:Transcript_15977/g.41323  ORF Transcript_15977/g.41323 Transcript_15977/m.41323 type:complete len:253 (-) Transcript_15977:272-1030(-)